MNNFVLLKEKALANIHVLFEYWNLQYIKVNEEEYDFINPTREDKNFGACRFNIKKGLGADFTGASFNTNDFSSFGPGFSKEDFNSFHDGKSISVGFDIIGLTQRLFKCDSYKEAGKLLNQHLIDISKSKKLNSISLDSAIRRQQELDEQNRKRIKIAKKTWDICLPIRGTLGQTYLASRMIYLEKEEPSIRFHPKIYNREVNGSLPAVLFKCSMSMDTELLAIHRIYLSKNGLKNNEIEISKVALGNIKGLAIWFGASEHLKKNSSNIYTDTNGLLRIAEGPENALSVYSIYNDLTCSTINANNFSNLTIPKNITKIILYPDNGEAGKKSVDKAYIAYRNQGIKDIEVSFPPERQSKWDWNDELQLMLRGKDGRK